MVQLIIAHPTSLTSSNLQEYLFNDFPMTHTHTLRAMVSSLMDFRLTSTRPCPTQARASNLHNLFIYNTFLQVPFSFNHSPLSLTSQLTTHKRYIYFPYMVFECQYNIRNQLVSTTIPSPSSFPDITTIGKQQHFGEILKCVFSYVFRDSIANANTKYR